MKEPVVLVTGAAGFLGFHVVRALALRGERVLGVDGLAGTPAPALTAARLARLKALEGFVFRRADLAEPGALARAAAGVKITGVVHLAGRATLRGPDPAALVRDNVVAQERLLAFCRDRAVTHLVHASSSAVQGGGQGVPRSAYGESKRRAEELTRAWAAAGGPPSTSLRYFTLYGPWSRPDSAAFVFADAILAGRPVRLHGHGRMWRCFTFVEDAAQATLAALARPPGANADGVRYALADVRHPVAVGLEEFVTVLESLLGRRALRERVPAEPEEMEADIGEDAPAPAFATPTSLGEGLARFAAWYLRTGRDLAGEYPFHCKRPAVPRPARLSGPRQTGRAGSGRAFPWN